MSRWLIIILLLTLILAPHVVNAQDSGEIERMHIDIWPEYDRPEVLVIYRISLSSVMSLPAELSIRIPKTVGKPFNVAMKDIDGLLYSLNYELINEDQWLRIKLISPSPDLQIEFYDPIYDCGENKHCYRYDWPGDYSIDSLTITVQQPLNSSNMQIEPNMGTGLLRPDELLYYTTLVGSLKKRETYSLQISYEKTDDTLSVSMQPVEPVEPLTQGTTGRTSVQEMLPLVAALAGLIMIISVGYWVWSSGWRFKPTTQQEPKQNSAREPVPGGSEVIVYCHQCGKRANASDLYCRTCGSKLHPEG